MNDSRDSIRPVAIVGAGVSGVMVTVVLRYSGLAGEDITLFDEKPASLVAWSGGTGAIQQRLMRSESEGHFFATDFPGFALIDALHRRSPAPLLRSVVNRYNPLVDDIMAHGRALVSHYRIAEAVQRVRVARVSREYLPIPHFALRDDAGEVRGRARHVMLALGHGPLRWPAVCATREVQANLAGVLWHAYEPKMYGRRVMVIGSGMSAATEWTNVLRRGGSVTAVRRARDVVEQPLSAPRCSFAGPWLDRYHSASTAERLTTLATLARGSFPGEGAWKRALRAGEASGQLRSCVGEVIEIRREGDAAVALVRDPESGEVEAHTVDTVIAATGFASHWREYEVLRNLVADHALETQGAHLVLADDCSLPGLSLDGSILSVAGAAARWAYPAADSFAGMKYAARRFAEHTGAHRLNPGRQAIAWWDMVRGGWPQRECQDAERRGDAACATR